MEKESFFNGIERLCLAFEHKIKPELSALIYEEISRWNESDWQAAIKALLSDPQRRHFPRIGEIQKALSDASIQRYQREKEDQQWRDRSEPQSAEGILKRIPFPHALKEALYAKMDGKMTQEQLVSFCQSWEAKEIEKEKLDRGT